MEVFHSRQTAELRKVEYPDCRLKDERLTDSSKPFLLRLTGTENPIKKQAQLVRPEHYPLSIVDNKNMVYLPFAVIRLQHWGHLSPRFSGNRHPQKMLDSIGIIFNISIYF